MSASGAGDIMTTLIQEMSLRVTNFDITDIDKVIDALYVVKSTGWSIISDAFSGSADVVNAISQYSTEIIRMNSLPGGLNIADALMMPFMSVFFCITLPSGMGIYWIASAVFRTIIYLFIDKFFNNKSVDEIIEANKEKAAKKAEKRGEQNAKLEEYAAMKTKNIDRRSISQIANTNKGDTDSKTAVKSSSGSSSSKGSKKVDKNSAEADKKSISGYAHMLNRHDD